MKDHGSNSVPVEKKLSVPVEKKLIINTYDLIEKETDIRFNDSRMYTESGTISYI